MTVQPSASALTAPVDAGRQLDQLRHILGLVEQIAGRGPPAPGAAALEETARLNAAYEKTSSLGQRRFDALTVETAGWAAAGIQALLFAEAGSAPPRAAAAALADELDAALRKLSRLVKAD